MATFEVRPALPEDRETILAFCSHTWEWGDYIAEAWDGWLEDPQGLLLVATSDGRAVGLLHLRMLNEREAWLEGLRVDPAYRRQGVASALHRAAMAEAIRRGATTVRLLTEATNSAAIALVKKSRMQEVGSFVPYQAPPLPELPRRLASLPSPELARPEDLEEIIDYLNVSNIFPLTGGLYYSGFIAYSISDRLLKTKIAAGEVYLLRRWERLDGLMMTEQREGRHGRYLFIGYIDGTTADTIGQLAYVLRHLAAQRNLEAVRAHVPDLLMVRDTFAGAEYQVTENPYITYERSLT
ncbi:GNAT family N-acetyltransferase [Thermogemmatispora sp.]|uniref:GNAT family N-acetyltransferase n=1 Tax=Thermogemmatispora sp. TaxID=1968838 RepID=UPI0035E425FA